VAGYDESTGETIIKVVNATDKEFAPTINLDATNVEAKGKVITLSSASKQDENSTANPTKIVPKTSEFKGFSKSFNYIFKPNSFTILRIKTRN
jgi:alpha-L-arabinofuranosidase